MNQATEDDLKKTHFNKKLDALMRQAFFVFILLCSFHAQGQEYFQQEVNYEIDVELNIESKSLQAYQKMEYLNNSPDTLHFIWFHLWPNAYKNSQTAYAKQKVIDGSTEFYYAKEKDRGYIDSLDFQVNGLQAKWEYHPKHIDIAKLYLPEPLLPGKRITITTPFYVKIPKGFSRLGANSEKESYQITQWYPKPAVYDKDGWHSMPYLDRGEFYSEFGNFEVNITLPSNYLVAASGDLLNEEELQWLSEIAELEVGAEKPANSFLGPKKTVQYRLENAHDFAWFCDPNYYVKKGSIQLPDDFRTVTTWVFYLEENDKLWKDAIGYVNDGVYYLSLWNYPYPFNHCIAVDGQLGAGGGMEYPGITVIGISPTANMLRSIIVHEIGHNWFYGMAGFNERKYPYLDEGLTTFNQIRYENEIAQYRLHKPDDKNLKALIETFDLTGYTPNQLLELAWRYIDRTENRQAPNVHSESFSMVNYGITTYYKVGFAWQFLREYIGTEKFDQGMHQFFSEWAHKHPGPEELKTSLEKFWDKNLDWFFTDLLGKASHIDYKPLMVLGKEIQIENYGSVPAPYQLIILNKNDTLVHEWREGHVGKKGIPLPVEDYSEIVVNPGLSGMDLYPQNNRLKGRPFQSRIKTRLFPILSLEVPHRKHLYFTPVFGLNQHNGFMIGLGFYNHFLLKRKIEYEFFPMYAIGSNSLAGKANLHFNINHRTSFGLEGKQFAVFEDNYQKLQAFIDYAFPIDLPSKQYLDFRLEGNLLSWTNLNPYYTDIRFQVDHQFKTKIEKSSSVLKFILHENYQRLQIESKYSKEINSWKDKIHFRVFAGINLNQYLWNTNSAWNNRLANYDMSLNGTMPGNDYLANHYFYSREVPIIQEITPWGYPDNYMVGQGFWQNQFAETDGGFYGNYGFIPANKTLTSLGFKYQPGITKIFYFFANAGANSMYYNTSTDIPVLSNELNTQGINYFFETGLEISLIPDAISIYIPVFTSKNLSNIQDAYGINKWERVRFQFRLDKFDPLYWTRNAHRLF